MFCGGLLFKLCNASLHGSAADSSSPFFSSFLYHSFMTLSSCLLLSGSLHPPEVVAWATSWVAQNTESFGNKVRASPFLYKDKRPKQGHSRVKQQAALHCFPPTCVGGNFPFQRPNDIGLANAVGSGGWKSLKDHKGNMHYLHVHGSYMP